MRCAVVVPVKSFTDAKARLAEVLSADQRVLLARLTAEAVIATVRDWSPHVVCDDPVVAAWAASQGAVVVDDHSRHLDGAVTTGIAAVRAAGFDHAAVVHADLVDPAPLVRLLGTARSGAVTLVPDSRDDGTNVAIVPTVADWRPAYGPGSFLRHLRAAQQMLLPVEVVHDRRLALDVDRPADLRHPSAVSLLRLVGDGAGDGIDHRPMTDTGADPARRSTTR